MLSKRKAAHSTGEHFEGHPGCLVLMNTDEINTAKTITRDYGRARFYQFVAQSILSLLGYQFFSPGVKPTIDSNISLSKFLIFTGSALMHGFCTHGKEWLITFDHQGLLP